MRFVVVDGADAREACYVVDVDLFSFLEIDVESIFVCRQYAGCLRIVEEEELRLVRHVELEVVEHYYLFLEKVQADDGLVAHHEDLRVL